MAAKNKSIAKKSSTVKSEKAVNSVAKKNLPSRFFHSLRTNRLTQFKVLSLVLFLMLLFSVSYSQDKFIVAFVNGKPIYREEVLSVLQEQGGSQVLDNLVTKKLILDHAQKNNIVITDEDIQSQIDTITKDIEAQGLTLEQALGFQGQTLEQFRDDIRLQLIIEKALEGKVNTTDEEISSYFEENKELFGEDEELENVKEEVRDTLNRQKLSELYQQWLTEIKENSTISYLVNYAPEATPASTE